MYFLTVVNTNDVMFKLSNNTHSMILVLVLRNGGKVTRRLSPTIRSFAPNRVLSTKVDSFLSGSSSVYIEQMYDSWRKEPSR